MKQLLVILLLGIPLSSFGDTQEYGDQLIVAYKDEVESYLTTDELEEIGL
ncbi:hypothetical protein [Vibrio sp. SCSIO 43136]|nr:hypothetical protein [Vibrio sp. SCSIO 43136]USD68153.1 hypothetical protein J4N39_18440 [Vibrio sp. SCSIO 43136]